jgi:P pilus assembly chaperone PapD
VLACALATTAALHPLSSDAQVVIDKVEIELDVSNRYDDIELTNPGDEPLYIQIEPSRIEHPGRPNEQRVSERNPESLGLLITPLRLIVPPGERHRVRVVALEPQPRMDQVFRVTIRPVVGRVETREKAAVKVIVAYDVLVLVRPPDAHASIEIDRNGRTATLRNTGNSSAVLHDGQQCDTSQTACQTLPARRLYGGAEMKLELPYDTPASYVVRFRERIGTRTF